MDKKVTPTGPANVVEQESDTATTTDAKIIWKEVTFNRMDSTVMKKAFTGIVEPFVKVSTKRRFTVQEAASSAPS